MKCNCLVEINSIQFNSIQCITRITVTMITLGPESETSSLVTAICHSSLDIVQVKLSALKYKKYLSTNCSVVCFSAPSPL